MYEAIRKEGKVIGIRRLKDGACIPLDSKNTDYQVFLLWLDANLLDLSDQPFTPSQEAVDYVASLADIKSQYQAAVDRLNQIVSSVNPTNTQVVQAIKDLAMYQTKILKIIKWMI